MSRGSDERKAVRRSSDAAIRSIWIGVSFAKIVGVADGAGGELVPDIRQVRQLLSGYGIGLSLDFGPDFIAAVAASPRDLFEDLRQVMFHAGAPPRHASVLS